MRIMAYLTLYTYGHIIEHMWTASSGWVDPEVPTDAKELESWMQPECTISNLSSSKS